MKKTILITLGVLTLTALIAGVWAYQHFFVLDPEIEAQLAQELPEGFYDFSDLDEDPEVTETASTNPQSTEQSDNEANSTQSNSSSNDSSASSTNQNATPITLVSIENSYLPKFKRLEDKAIERLDELFEIAAQEYKQKQKDGTLDKTEFTRKFMQAATKLETVIDENFDQVIIQMENELKENKLPTDSVKVIKKKYNEAISTKKSELLSKISGS